MSAVVHLPTDRRFSLAWCHSCGRRDALHFQGRCTMADRHADKVCRDCGRQTSGERCSACEEAAS